MTAARIERPVWRSFRPRFLDRAIKWARAGGVSAILPASSPTSRRAFVLAPCTRGEIPELSYWVALALDDNEPRIVRAGRAKGLVRIALPSDLEGTVDRWCDRDAAWRTPVRTVALDCTSCAACCVNNRVVLYGDDLERWRDADRADLARTTYVKGRGVRRVLRLLDDGRCVHLRKSRSCAIYELRPDNCRLFPAGSESCLNAREREFGWIDTMPLARSPSR